MTKRDDKASKSTSRGRDKAFSKSSGKSRSTNHHSEAAGNGERNHYSNDTDRSKPKRSYSRDVDAPRADYRSERPRFEDRGNSSEDRPARRFDSRSSERPARRFDSRESGNDRPFRKHDGEHGGERRFGGNSDRPARRFDHDSSDRPARRFGNDSSERPARRFDSDSSERPARRFDSNSSDRSSRSFDNRGGDDRKPYRKPEGDRGFDRPSRRFDHDSSERPARRFDNESSDRPSRRFDEDLSENRTSRRFDSFGSDRPARRFEDNARGDRRPSREDDKDHGYNRDRKPAGERSSNLKPRRRDINAESEILSEIVANRRETGRLTSNKQQVLSLKWEEENRPIRLNKYISNSGICSRREADRLIETGAILVNDKIVTELGTKVFPTDIVRFEDKILNREKPVYIILNKPKDYITTLEDERGRKNVMELIAGACRERVYPVGRLDRNTTGLLLFTNDGEMAKKLTHPKFGIRKIYQVELDKALSYSDMQTIADGLQIDDDVYIKPDDIAYASTESKKVIGIEIHSGQNRIVRRIFESLGYEVVKLDRTVYAGLTKKDLPRGRWRILTKDEIGILKMTVS